MSLTKPSLALCHLGHHGNRDRDCRYRPRTNAQSHFARTGRQHPLLWIRAVCWMLAMALLSGCATTPSTAPLTAQAADSQAATPAPLLVPESLLGPADYTLAPLPPPAELLQPLPDLWTRFRNKQVWPVCEESPAVTRWIRLYAGSPDRFANNLRPLLPAMDYVLSRSEAEGLPSEVMLVPLIESYYRPDARGPGGALGMWQLMPDTARRFGLGMQSGSDERLDLQSSTDAAMHLLSIHAQSFPQYPRLIFAAYNAGGYRVRKALAGREFGPDVSLEKLGLSRTTRDYLDKMKALGCLLGDPDRFDLDLPDMHAGEQLSELLTPFPIDPEKLIEQIGMEDGQIRRWNQQAYLHRATTPERPLLLPSMMIAAASRSLANGELPRAVAHTPKPLTQPPASNRQMHRVQSGDSLWTISKRYRVRMGDLMQWNGLNKRSVLRIGQVLQLATP